MKKSELLQIPNVGPEIARMLRLVGINSVADLKGKSPEKMYAQLMAVMGQHIDRCVLYVFRSAVYFASNTKHEPAKLKWWHWKD